MTGAAVRYVKQYVAFEDERTRPVRDLVAAIPNGQVSRAVDLGCGPGNSTQVLAARFPAAAITGVDSAPDMVEAARSRLPKLEFRLEGIESWNEPGPFDVILANASLQWIPNHAVLYPRLLSKLSPGGSLAVQTPDNLDEPAQRLIRDVAQQGPWAGKLASVAREPREGASWYYELLRSECKRVDVWRTIYYHPLAGGAKAVVEWFKGSGLRPYLGPLDEAERAEFLDQYTAAVGKSYPALRDGTVLLPFPRLFLVATR